MTHHTQDGYEIKDPRFTRTRKAYRWTSVLVLKDGVCVKRITYIVTDTNAKEKAIIAAVEFVNQQIYDKSQKTDISRSH